MDIVLVQQPIRSLGYSLQINTLYTVWQLTKIAVACLHEMCFIYLRFIDVLKCPGTVC